VPPDELLTVREVAEYLKLNPQTVRNWIDAGQLAGVRVGSRRVRVRRSELDRFLAAGQPKPREAPERGATAELATALRDPARAAEAEDPAGLAGALRAVAAAAERLAVALEGGGLAPAAFRSDHRCGYGVAACCFPTIRQSGERLTDSPSLSRAAALDLTIASPERSETHSRGQRGGQPRGPGSSYPCVCRSQRGVRAA
jgi:excisionase family DNA binding protein